MHKTRLQSRMQSPSGVRYSWGEINGAQVVDAFDLYGLNVDVNTSLLAPAETLIITLVATGAPRQHVANTLGCDASTVSTRLAAVYDALLVPRVKGKNRLRTCQTISRLCLAGSLLRSKPPADIPQPNRTTARLLELICQTDDWTCIDQETDCGSWESASRYLLRHYPEPRVVRLPEQLLVHAFCSNYVDAGQVVAGQAAPPPEFPLPKMYLPLMPAQYEQIG